MLRTNKVVTCGNPTGLRKQPTLLEGQGMIRFSPCPSTYAQNTAPTCKQTRNIQDKLARIQLHIWQGINCVSINLMQRRKHVQPIPTHNKGIAGFTRCESISSHRFPFGVFLGISSVGGKVLYPKLGMKPLM